MIVSWDHVTLVILAVFGTATLLLAEVRELLVRLPDVIEAWHEVRRCLQGRDPGKG